MAGLAGSHFTHHEPARPFFVLSYSAKGAGLREIARPKFSSARRAALTLSCTGPAVLHRGQYAKYPLSVRLTSGVKKALGCSHDFGGVASMAIGAILCPVPTFATHS